MYTSGKIISIDFDLLKQLLVFDHVQLFEVDSLDSPNCFTEYPVPAYLVPSTDPRFNTVSRRVMMRLGGSKERPIVHVPKKELLADGEFNVSAILLADKSVPLVLFFFSRLPPSASLDVNQVSRAVISG